MASFTERLAYIITANGRDAIKTFRDVGNSAKQSLGAAEGAVAGLGAKAKGAGSGLMGLAGGIAATFGAQAVTESVNAASDMEQSVGAVSAVFGDASGIIEDFAETAAQTAGLSKREVNEMASVIGAGLRNMGFSATGAATQVVELERRAADLAAQFGGTTRDAIEAMASALRGERDPIERYGVSIKQADVSARIAAKGLDTHTTAAEKNATAIATLELIMEQSASAQGAFGREQDTAAGALARYHAELENLQISLGEGLLPLLASGADALGLFTRAAQTVTKPVGGVGSAIKGVVKNLPGMREISFAAKLFGKDSDDAEPKAKKLAETTADLGTAADGAATDVIKTVDALKSYKDAIDDTLGARLDARDAARSLADAEDEVAELIELAGDAAETATSKTRSYEDALEDIFGGALDVEEAHDSAADAIERLSEVLGLGSENAEDFMDRFARGDQTVEGHADAIKDAARAAVRAAQEEVDAMAETGDIADTAGARNAALTDKLIDLRNRFPQVADQIDKYLDRLRRVPSLSTESQIAAEKLADKKDDLAGATDDLIQRAKDEADQQETVIGKYTRLLETLGRLKVEYPALADAIQQAIDDTNAAVARFWNDPANNSWGASMTRDSMARLGRVADNDVARYGGFAGMMRNAAAASVVNNTTVNVKVDGTGLTQEAAADYFGQRIAWAVTSARK